MSNGVNFGDSGVEGLKLPLTFCNGGRCSTCLKGSVNSRFNITGVFVRKGTPKLF